MNDYYEILGVSRDATESDIKKAYRKKARQLHPDYGGDEEAFKNLSVAYETLSDPQKRELYDLGGPDAVRGGGAGGADMFGDFGVFSDFVGSMFSSAFGGGASRGPVPRSRPGQDHMVAVELTLEEVAFGVSKEVSYGTYVACEACHGSMCAPGSQPRRCNECSGSGFVQRIQNSLFGQMRTEVPCGTCRGHGDIIDSPCSECAGQGRVRTNTTVTVDIPAGVESGNRIRIAGKGEIGPGGGPHGDLYLEVRERKHEIFDRRGDDLYTRITVPMTVAALGTTFDLTTLDGLEKMTIAPGTQPGAQIKLEGFGVGRLRRNGRGNLYVHVDVEIPRGLDERSKQLLEELATHRGEERFEVPEVSEPSVFERIRDKIKERR